MFLMYYFKIMDAEYPTLSRHLLVNFVMSVTTMATALAGAQQQNRKFTPFQLIYLIMYALIEMARILKI